MVHIVHWRDMVGKDFIEQFITLTRSIMTMEINNRPYEDAFKKMGVEVRRDYETKRNVMRFSGYEETKFGWKRHGWYTAYLERNEVKFHCTAPESERKYIALGNFITWKNYNIAALEEYDNSDFEREVDVTYA